MKCQWLITVLELLSAKACYKKRKYETAEPWRNREILTKKNSVENYFCSIAICYYIPVFVFWLMLHRSLQNTYNQPHLPEKDIQYARKNELLIAFNKLINFKSVIVCFTSVFYDCFHMIIAHTLSNLLFDIYLLNDAFSIFEFPWL